MSRIRRIASTAVAVLCLGVAGCGDDSGGGGGGGGGDEGDSGYLIR